MRSFVVCLFYLDGYGVVQGIFVFCLFYLYGYGVVQEIVYVLLVLPLWLRVVQGIFCCLFVLSLSLWCRSRDLLLFVCFIFIVMVSFKGAFVFCLFYLYGYGVVQGSFCCLFVLPL
jgi:hypothetical protein